MLGADALRMRLRRLCEVKGSGRMWCDQKTREDYVAGGERRQWLELALLESLKRHGSHRGAYDKVKAWWLKNVGVYCLNQGIHIFLIQSKPPYGFFFISFPNIMKVYNQLFRQLVYIYILYICIFTSTELNLSSLL